MRPSPASDEDHQIQTNKKRQLINDVDDNNSSSSSLSSSFSSTLLIADNNHNQQQQQISTSEVQMKTLTAEEVSDQSSHHLSLNANESSSSECQVLDIKHSITSSSSETNDHLSLAPALATSSPTNLDPNAREFTPASSSSPISHDQQQQQPLLLPPDFYTYLPDTSQGYDIAPYDPSSNFILPGAAPNYPSYDIATPAGLINYEGEVVFPHNTAVANSAPGFVPTIAMAMAPPQQPVIYPSPSVEAMTAHPHVPTPNTFIGRTFHQYSGSKEHISRALLITGVPSHLSESQVLKELEQWGAVRNMQYDRISEGFVTVQYFDLRSSRQALRDMQSQHLLRQQQFQQHYRGINPPEFPLKNTIVRSDGCNIYKDQRKGLICGNVVWAQYIAAWSMPVPDMHNQGTLVLFNMGADVNLEDIREVFKKFGDVRELREAPLKRQHKFVEFYDVRDAAAAWNALNGQEVCGKCVKIEFSRQGGVTRRQKPLVRPNQEPSMNNVSAAIVPHGHIPEPHGWGGDGVLHGWQGYANAPVPPQWSGRLPIDNQAPLLSEHHHCSLPGPNIIDDRAMGIVDFPKGALQGSDKGKRTAMNGVRQGEITGPRRRRNNTQGSEVKPGQIVVKIPHAGGSNNRNAAMERHDIPRHSIMRGAHLHFEFDEREVFLLSGNPRTTLMIRNIPNKYSQQMLISLLDKHCLECNRRIIDINEPESAYDFVYLPIDFKNRCNLGYAFVNFTTAIATLKFYRSFHEQAWEAFNSRKICKIAYARVQGRGALEDHFRNSRFACDTDEYLPLVFVPPRNGIELTTPRVVAGYQHQQGASKACRTGDSRGTANEWPLTLSSLSQATTPATSIEPTDDQGLSDCIDSSNSSVGDTKEKGDNDDIDNLNVSAVSIGA